MNKNKKRVVITVDGLAGSGKSTLSRLLAEKLAFAHLNSGLLYRAIAYLALKSKVDCHNGKALDLLAAHHSIALKCDERLSSRVFLDEQDISDRIQAPEISQATSIASAQPEVRARLIQLQRSAFEDHNLVAEGRDMGTVVFPDAPCKFFVIASEEVRVERRISQLSQKNGKSLSAEDRKALEHQMKIEIHERDRRDAERSISPTKPADGAIIIDNSVLPLTQIVSNMYDFVRKKGL